MTGILNSHCRVSAAVSGNFQLGLEKYGFCLYTNCSTLREPVVRSGVAAPGSADWVRNFYFMQNLA